MAVHLKPMPESYRKIRKIFRPKAPPIFVDCQESGPSPEDRELARELFRILDPESQDWYGRRGVFEDID